ncbi:MAG: Hsp20/alpha crystallin family protein [Acidimicrobiia bacterium]|nr:Hsp20/alpha crystallin family protein [Acidimicrobiia bacterium]
MAMTRRSGQAPGWAAWPDWPSRRIQDWFEGRGRPRFDWPDWAEPWVGSLDTSPLKVEEYEEEGKLVVRAELPGIDPETDVDITVSDHLLRLKAERRQETKTEHKTGYRSEFSYGAFSRTLPLPPGTSDEEIEATYADGILEVRIPIDDEAKAHKIPISRG